MDIITHTCTAMCNMDNCSAYYSAMTTRENHMHRYLIDIHYTDGTVETKAVKSDKPATPAQLKASVMRKMTPASLNTVREIKTYERCES